jgi:hypothetical protein
MQIPQQSVIVFLTLKDLVLYSLIHIQFHGVVHTNKYIFVILVIKLWIRK